MLQCRHMGKTDRDKTFDFVVIGSGFGGSVAAMRLAQKGYGVLVLERGKRFRDQDFALDHWRHDTKNRLTTVIAERIFFRHEFGALKKNALCSARVAGCQPQPPATTHDLRRP